MADFKWTKGREPKTTDRFIITIRDGDDFLVFTDVYDTGLKEWAVYDNEDIIAHAPLPRPFRPRQRRKK